MAQIRHSGSNKRFRLKLWFCGLSGFFKSWLYDEVTDIFELKFQKVGGFAKSPDFSEVSNCLMRTIHTGAQDFLNPVKLFEQALVRYLVNTNSWCNQPCISAPEVAARSKQVKKLKRRQFRTYRKFHLRIIKTQNGQNFQNFAKVWIFKL